MTEDLIKILKSNYKGIKEIEKEENESITIIADDDTLWKIIEDLRDNFNMEFEAGVGVDHFVKIIL